MPKAKKRKGWKISAGGDQAGLWNSLAVLTQMVRKRKKH